MTKLIVFAFVALFSVAAAVDRNHGKNLRKEEPAEEGASGMLLTMNTAKKGSAGVVVVSETFCASILVAIEKKQAPYWDSEGGEGEGCCNEDRPDLLAQCDKRLIGFLSKVASMCPSIDPPVNDDFKKVEYVADAAKVATAAQHTKPPVPIKDDCEDCDDDEEEVQEALKRTPDGKPVKAWGTAPNAPSQKVDAHAAEGQCDGKPCPIEDVGTVPPCVTEDGVTPGPCPGDEDEVNEGE